MEVELRTDHGSQYTGGDCRALLGRWGVEQTFSPVGRPTGNAVVERLHRTLKEEVIWLQDWEDAAEVERAVAAAIAWLDANAGAAKDEIDEQLSRLQRVADPIISSVYERQGGERREDTP